MILEALAASNFLLGVYDTYITQRRIRAFGTGFELNKVVKYLSTPLGPRTAAVIGVLGPVVGWTWGFTYFHLTWLLALWVGYGIKRAEVQQSSDVFHQNVIKVKNMLDEFGHRDATLPSEESTSKGAQSISKEGK